MNYLKNMFSNMFSIGNIFKGVLFFLIFVIGYGYYEDNIKTMNYEEDIKTIDMFKNLSNSNSVKSVSERLSK